MRDGSTCSVELKQYLSEVSSIKIGLYVRYCVDHSFQNSGFVLQDLINEIGRRLEYDVSSGLYRGKKGEIGFDGLWKGTHSLVVEVKTSDTYRITLDTLAEYRHQLVGKGIVSDDSSVLIVVGRQDTGELEAQIRGSRHAWNMRLISSEALLKLGDLKENTDDPETGDKIRTLLIPFESTKIDRIVDVMFSAAKDAAAAVETESLDEEAVAVDSVPADKKIYEFTDSKTLDNKRVSIVSAFASKLGVALIKRSRALYWDAAHETRLACTVSKRYEKRGQVPYWYAYHPQWDSFLGDGSSSYLVLGCMDQEFAFAIPAGELRTHLHEMNQTARPGGGAYWHIKIVRGSSGALALQLPKINSSLPLDPYRITVGA